MFLLPYVKKIRKHYFLMVKKFIQKVTFGFLGKNPQLAGGRADFLKLLSLFGGGWGGWPKIIRPTNRQLRIVEPNFKVTFLLNFFDREKILFWFIFFYRLIKKTSNLHSKKFIFKFIQN